MTNRARLPSDSTENSDHLRHYREGELVKFWLQALHQVYDKAYTSGVRYVRSRLT